MKRSRVSAFRGRLAAGAACAFLVVLAAAGAFAAGPSMMAGFPLRAGSNVMLMWMPFPGATTYNVYRGEAPGGPYQKLAEVPMNMHTDMNVSTDKSFYYVVKGVIGGKEGDPSSEAVMKGLEPMTTPKFIGDLLTPDNKLALRWEGNPKAAFFNLYRSETEKGEYALLSSVQDSKYTDGKVEVGKTYYYKVTSVSSSNVESPKGDKPLVIKIEKKAAEEAQAQAVVNINVKMSNTYDLDGEVILRAPRDVEPLPDGMVAVVDGRGFLHIIDKEQKFVRYIGQIPAGFQGEWGFLSGVDFDSKAKELYLSYSTINAIRVFDLEGKLLRTLSLLRPDPKVAPEQGFVPAPMDAAMGVDGVLWVVDGDYYMAIGLDPKTGKELKRYGLGRGNPERAKEKDGGRSLDTPGNISVSQKSGNIYIVEGGGQRLTVLNKAGDYLFHLGSRGSAPGKFLVPAAINIGDDDTVWVGDRNTGFIQAFDGEGKYKGTLTLPKKEDPQAKLRTGVGITGLAARGKQIFYADNIGERLVVYDILP